jgi:hypothetical protein
VAFLVAFFVAFFAAFFFVAMLDHLLPSTAARSSRATIVDRCIVVEYKRARRRVKREPHASARADASAWVGW